MKPTIHTGKTQAVLGHAKRAFLRPLATTAAACVLAVLTASSAPAKAPSITATLEPPEISLGDSAQLTVTVQGQNESTPEVPPVDGLSFEPVGQSSQIQIINGAMSANISHTYLVSASRLGAFTIPRIKVGSGRDIAESQPLVLKVLKRVGGAAPPNRPSALPAPAVNGADQEVSAPHRDSVGFLQIISPKQEFFVGEMVPVELKAYFRAGVELRVDGLPKLNSDAFTMNKLGDQPARSQQTLGGVPYTVFTWPTAITAVKAGDYEMSVEIPTTVTVRQRAQRPRAQTGNPFGNPLFDDFFNDSFFDNFFGTAAQRQVALSSQPSAVKILSLPADSRPSGFAGAVGRFDLAAEAAPPQVTAGDPVTLKLKITGSGNFDRVAAPVVEMSETWKVYKPSAKFKPEDSAGYSGTKTFEQALVPTQPGKLEIPALAFNFFDPEKKQYLTRTTPALSIEVTASQAAAVPAPAAKPASVTAATTAGPELVPNKLTPGHFVATLRPWVLNPWLVTLSSSPLLGMAVALVLIRRRERRANDPALARSLAARRAVREQLDAMESAVRLGEAGLFFAAARNALRQQLGLRWGVRPEAITLAEIDTQMNGEAEGFRPIFALADEVTYTGRTFPATELERWKTVVRNELKKLEAV